MPAPGIDIKVSSSYPSNGGRVAVYVRDWCTSYDSINWGWGLTFGFLDCWQRGCCGFTIRQSGMEKGLAFHPKMKWNARNCVWKK